jgi:hypothetical protein
LPALLLALAGVAALGCEQPPPLPEIPITPDEPVIYSLPAIPLGRAQNAALPGSVRDDRGIQLGGLFSDLTRDPRDPTGTFWALPDRGPNSWIGRAETRIFPVPDYNPTLFRVRLAKGRQIEIVETVPILTKGGRPVTGLPDLPDGDEVPFSIDGKQRLAVNPNGIDPEGLAVAPDGTFWLAEEYGPSLLHLSPRGRVLARWVPEGRTRPPASYPVVAALPAVFGRRRANRGFESLALSSDGGLLYSVVQSPLALPDDETGRASRLSRLLAWDTRIARPVAQHVYVMETASAFTDGRETDQNEMKISGLSWVAPTRLLALERTDRRAKVYEIDLGQATDLLGGRFDSLDARPALESLGLERLQAEGVVPMAKRLVVDLGRLRGMPQKIEGLTIVARDLLAVGCDNDFDVDANRGRGGFDPSGRLIPSHPPRPSQLLLVRLPRPLEMPAEHVRVD